MFNAEGPWGIICSPSGSSGWMSWPSPRQLGPGQICIANRDVCIRAVFPNPTNASSLLEISRFWHSSQIAGLQPCKIGIASRSGNLWLPACSLFPAAPPGSIRERPPVDGADTPQSSVQPTTSAPVRQSGTATASVWRKWPEPRKRGMIGQEMRANPPAFRSACPSDVG